MAPEELLVESLNGEFMLDPDPQHCFFLQIFDLLLKKNVCLNNKFPVSIFMYLKCYKPIYTALEFSEPSP